MKKDSETIVEIFADGACSGNPGPGGYGAILKYGSNKKEISGCEETTTNNRMELMAVIAAFKQLKKPCNIRVISDSTYVIKGMKEWIPGWLKKNWMNSRKQPVLNRDLWELLLELSASHKVEWLWIKGHDGHVENERCDEMARNAIKKCNNI
jgi:ribonuclease HI